jgi:carbamoyl-phosphate synthase small subunit
MDIVVITSQNHGYAVNAKTLGSDWKELFVNMNDGSNEGICHTTNPWFTSQFHPEACSGPVDTEFMFDKFVETLK